MKKIHKPERKIAKEKERRKQSKQWKQRKRKDGWNAFVKRKTRKGGEMKEVEKSKKNRMMNPTEWTAKIK